MCFVDLVMQSLNDGNSVFHNNTGNHQRIMSGLWNGRLGTENTVEGWEQ